MKILWVMKKHFDLATDSSARVEMIRNLEKRGHSVIFLTGYKKEKKTFGLKRNIRFVPAVPYPFLFHVTFNACLTCFLLYYAVRWRPDVVMMDPTSCMAAFPVNLFMKLGLVRSRFILDVRTIPVETSGAAGKLNEILFGLSLQYAKRFFDGITVITPFMREYLARQYRLDGNRIGHWSSGVSLKHFDPGALDQSRVDLLRKQLGLKEKFVIIYHGTLTANRGLKETVEALTLLRDYPDIRLLIVGRGPAREELEALARHWNLESQVTICGPVPYDDIPYYIALADVGILPFPGLIWWRVSSPIKLMEYLAMGKPVVVTEIEAHRDVLDDYEGAFFVDSHEPQQIANKLLEAYQLGDEQLRQLGMAGRKLISESTWEQQAHTLEALLGDV